MSLLISERDRNEAGDDCDNSSMKKIKTDGDGEGDGGGTTRQQQPDSQGGSDFTGSVRKREGVTNSSFCTRGLKDSFYRQQRHISSSPPRKQVPSQIGINLASSSSDATLSRSLYKVKRFLFTLIQFGSDINPYTGDKVRELVYNVVAGNLLVSDFHQVLQEVTNFPLRPFVLPFLKASIPLLSRNVSAMAVVAHQTPLQYLRSHQHFLKLPNGEIFHSEAAFKRMNRDTEFPVEAKRPKEQQRPSTGEDKTTDSHDEWKNIHVMLTCILGMVGKTQRALTILQQRQTTPRAEMPPPTIMSDVLAATIRSTEEKMGEVRRKAEDAVQEVKRAAVEELQRAAVALAERSVIQSMIRERLKVLLDSETKALCWNCDREAIETCSGCKAARYCSRFCQHKDWEGHHKVCCTLKTNASSDNVGQIKEKNYSLTSPFPTDAWPKVAKPRDDADLSID